MFRFTIRDVLWLTVVVALVCGWAVDRSSLNWRYQQANAAMERLRERLDAVDADWRRDERLHPPLNIRGRGSILFGLGLFAVAVALIALVWRGYLHSSILEWRRRG